MESASAHLDIFNIPGEFPTRLRSVSGQEVTLGLVATKLPGHGRAQNSESSGLAQKLQERVMLGLLYVQEDAVCDVDDGVGRLGRRLSHDAVAGCVVRRRCQLC